MVQAVPHFILARGKELDSLLSLVFSEQSTKFPENSLPQSSFKDNVG